MARAVTGKKKLIKFLGHYHGWGHEYLMDVEVPGSGKFVTNGIPDEYMDQTILVPPNDLNALEAAFKAYAHDGGVAALIIEPYGAESGLVPIEDGFNAGALEIAHRHGALFIMDEVVTGFRLGKGGAQQRLGVMPDLTTLGKGLMNGFPSCGAVGGRADIMDAAHTSIPYQQPYTYVAGTLSGNALSVAACKYVVSTLSQSDVLEKAEATAADLVEKLNQMFAAYQTDFFAYHIGNILRVELTAPHAVPLTSPEALMEVVQRRQILSSYSAIVASTGVLSRHGRDFVSCAHGAEDNDRYVAGYEKLMQSLQR
jgi:glutamate-1-semialdehyde aminotransferase